MRVRDIRVGMLTRRILFIAPAQTVTSIFPQLKEAGFEVGIAENLKGASSFIRKGVPGLILSRPTLPDYSAEDLLAVGKDDKLFPPVIVFSDKATSSEAKQMLEFGAKDYWMEPITFEKIQAAMPAKSATQTPAISTLGGQKDTASSGAKIIGDNEVMQRVLALARQVAKSKATVLISGESGTGKEMFSRYLHMQSDRANKPFIAVNCAALPEHLLESELFGHEKGAFTGAISRKLGKFELADGGTLLLDEISEMDLALQAKLLRALQEGEIDRVGGSETVSVDVRVLATTNRKLESWVEEGKFRQDLYYRLNVIPLRLPSLKERGRDVLLLARFFIDLYVREYSLPVTDLSAEAISWLEKYEWPGNVRELQNIMERAVLLSAGKPIDPSHFLFENDDWPLFIETPDSESETLGQSAIETEKEANPSVEAISNTSFPSAVIPLHEMERIMIQKGLEHTAGNRTQAAELLGISVRTLRNKLNEYRDAGLVIE